jgi:hypothetical protein
VFLFGFGFVGSFDIGMRVRHRRRHWFGHQRCMHRRRFRWRRWCRMRRRCMRALLAQEAIEKGEIFRRILFHAAI